MSVSFKSSINQAFPPKPSFTEENLPDLLGNVYIVTGSNTGVGKELARMLYSKNAKVYMMGRSAVKMEQAMADIKKAVPSSEGDMVFIKLDLADLSSIKKTVQQFLAMESKLHVLVNNAGTMSSEKKLTTTPQGHEQHVGINALGPFLLTKLLTPILVNTAKSAPPNMIRVAWVGSSASEIFAEKDVGATAEMMKTETLAKKSGNERYWASKVANWSHGVEYALRHKTDGIISIPVNPGNLKSDLYRDQGIMMAILGKIILYPPINGAYTELFAALSPEITMEKTGSWVVPFGRIYPIRQDLDLAIKPTSEGGTGGTKKFWDWSEVQVKAFI